MTRPFAMRRVVMVWIVRPAGKTRADVAGRAGVGHSWWQDRPNMTGRPGRGRWRPTRFTGLGHGQGQSTELRKETAFMRLSMYLRSMLRRFGVTPNAARPGRPLRFKKTLGAESLESRD